MHNQSTSNMYSNQTNTLETISQIKFLLCNVKKITLFTRIGKIYGKILLFTKPSSMYCNSILITIENHHITNVTKRNVQRKNNQQRYSFLLHSNYHKPEVNEKAFRENHEYNWQYGIFIIGH